MNDEQAQHIASALRDISYGGTSGPTGLEAVTMALAGPGVSGHDSVASAIRDVADALREVAEAIRETVATPNVRICDDGPAARPIGD